MARFIVDFDYDSNLEPHGLMKDFEFIRMRTYINGRVCKNIYLTK